MKAKNIICALALLLLQGGVHAAGFNCAVENLNETEETICQTPYLSGIDNVSNKLFIGVMNNTLSKGTVQAEQLEWLKDRNSCRKNTACIKEHYLKRNAELSSFQGFHTLAEVFPESLIDAPFDRKIINKNGFTIRDNPWVIKRLFSEPKVERDFNIKDGYWNILTHMEVRNNLAVIFTVETKGTTYLILISDITSQSQIIDSYDSESDSAPEIKLIYRDEAGFSYKVSNVYDPMKHQQVSSYYEITVSDSEKITPKKISRPQKEFIKDKTWTGYCGDRSCESELLSPDGKWRVASGDGDIEYRNDGVYYFPHDRPDLGVNVFISSVEDKDDGFSFMRSYVWGHENSFFFDNDGGYACIWKTDISQKTTERILPVERLQKPYYLRYKNTDYVISLYIYAGNNDEVLREYYIAKE